MIDTWCKVEKHKGKINKTLNQLITELEMSQKRKFVFVKINNVKIKQQLVTGPDITIINERTWRKMGKPILLTSKRSAHEDSGKKLNFWGEFYKQNFYCW